MSKLITHLEPNEVFIYGANSTGHSCSGSAGWAVRGAKTGTDWRADPWVQRAMAAPEGSPDRIGNWGVYGVARGWSKGHHGMSYAIETVVRPGLKRSTPLYAIQAQLIALCGFCYEHPEWRFLMTAVGSQLAGYSEEEMAETFLTALDDDLANAPPNLIIPIDLYGVNWSMP